MKTLKKNNLCLLQVLLKDHQRNVLLNLVAPWCVAVPMVSWIAEINLWPAFRPTFPMALLNCKLNELNILFMFLPKRSNYFMWINNFNLNSRLNYTFSTIFHVLDDWNRIRLPKFRPRLSLLIKSSSECKSHLSFFKKDNHSITGGLSLFFFSSDLSNNQISTIAGDAFHGLKSLTSL